eukprot:m.96467 g.96467  ORF g.96467 m.96467 type:complete len:250 (+) comp10165_c2_seq1:111-860(+)
MHGSAHTMASAMMLTVVSVTTMFSCVVEAKSGADPSHDVTARCETNADCGAGEGHCLPVPEGVPGAAKYCITVLPGHMLRCPTPMPGNQCCSDANCTSPPTHGDLRQGRCESYDSGPMCGGPLPPQINVCRYDQCSPATGHHCPAGDNDACLPRGFLQSRASTCAKATCQADTDCPTDHECRPFASPSYCRGFEGLHCVNPKTAECVVDSDCKDKTPKGEPAWLCGWVDKTSEPKCMRPVPPPPATHRR